LDQLSKV